MLLLKGTIHSPYLRVFSPVFSFTPKSLPRSSKPFDQHLPGLSHGQWAEANGAVKDSEAGVLCILPSTVLEGACVGVDLINPSLSLFKQRVILDLEQFWSFWH